MTRTVLLIVAVAALSAPSVTAATAQSSSGTEMLEHCRNEKSLAWPHGFCTGLVAGLVTAAPYMEGEARFCPPPSGVTPKQARRVVVRYLEQNPQITHRPLRYLAMEALQKAWPCSPAATSR